MASASRLKARSLDEQNLIFFPRIHVFQPIPMGRLWGPGLETEGGVREEAGGAVGRQHPGHEMAESGARTASATFHLLPTPTPSSTTSDHEPRAQRCPHRSVPDPQERPRAPGSPATGLQRRGARADGGSVDGHVVAVWRLWVWRREGRGAQDALDSRAHGTRCPPLARVSQLRVLFEPWRELGHLLARPLPDSVHSGSCHLVNPGHHTP